MLNNGGYNAQLNASQKNPLMDAAHERKPINQSSLRNAGANILGFTETRN
jgi:hypothetical protein